MQTCERASDCSSREASCSHSTLVSFSSDLSLCIALDKHTIKSTQLRTSLPRYKGSLMAAASLNPTLQTTEQRSTGTGSKRNATHEQGGEGSPSQGPTRASKRSRTAVHAAVGDHEKPLNRSSGNDDDHDDEGRDDATGDYAHLPPLSKHATEKEKEARRMARMIRNRSEFFPRQLCSP